MDRWILSELALTNRKVIEHMDAYRVYEATRVLTDFVDALSNWYVRRNRDRFWAPGLEQDKLDAHWTLYECLVATACSSWRPSCPSRRRRCGRTWCVGLRRTPRLSSRCTSATYPEPDSRASSTPSSPG